MHIIDDMETPIFVCERCGKISRILFYNEGDEFHCPYCKNVMINTEYSIFDYEYDYYFGDNEEAKQFRCDIFIEFVKHNKKFDEALQRKRLDSERKFQKHESEKIRLYEEAKPKKRGRPPKNKS